MVLKRSSRLFNDVKHKKEKNLKRVLTRAEYLKEDYSAHGATALLNVKHIEFIFHLKVLFYTGHDEKDTFTAISNNLVESFSTKTYLSHTTHKLSLIRNKNI